MLKKLFATFVSVAMLFSMSTSAMSVQAETVDEAVTITVRGAVDDTIEVYYRVDNEDYEDARCSYTIEPAEYWDDIRFSVVEGFDVLSVSNSGWSENNNARGGGRHQFQCFFRRNCSY